MADIISALLCDFAQVRDNLLFVSSGGISRIYRQVLPAPLGVMLAVVVELEPEEILEPHELRVTICESTTAEPLGTITHAQQIGEAANHPGESLQAFYIFDLRQAGVKSYGPHDIRVTFDDDKTAIRTVYVIGDAATQ